MREAFQSTSDIVDVDDSVEFPSKKLVVEVDRAKAARLGVAQSDVAQALATVLNGESMSYLHGDRLVAAVRALRLHRAHPGGDPGGLLRGDAQAGGLDPNRHGVSGTGYTRSWSVQCAAAMATVTDRPKVANMFWVCKPNKTSG